MKYEQMYKSFNNELSKSFDSIKRKSASFANEAPLAVSKKELLSSHQEDNTNIIRRNFERYY